MTLPPHMFDFYNRMLEQQPDMSLDISPVTNELMAKKKLKQQVAMMQGALNPEQPAPAPAPVQMEPVPELETPQLGQRRAPRFGLGMNPQGVEIFKARV
jgi:hypothetical protein